jgi:glycosyltransferase involved in cell wall biosynthesis
MEAPEHPLMEPRGDSRGGRPGEAASSRLRIAIALPHLGVYGGIRRFLELGRVWTERGHEVAYALERRDSAETPWLAVPGAVGPIESLDRGGFHAVITPDPALLARAGAPGALRVFYAVLEKAPGEREAWRSADLVLANSAGMGAYLAKRGVEAVDASGGVNTSFFHPPSPDPRRGNPAGRDPLCVLVYGRVSRRRKGTWTAARAVERAARSTGRRVELVLFETPQPGEVAPALPSALAIPHRWVLRPTQEELRDLYGSADVFVSAERRAGWSNTAAEAMACGAAVVSTRSGTEDFAVDGDTAAVTRWPWTWTLAGKLAPLLRDPARRIAIAERGRARISEFTWERTADRIEKALAERLHGGPT